MLGFILGPMMEENLRRTLLLSKGNPSIFFTRPLSAVLLLMAMAMLVIVILPAISKKREAVFAEEE
jgi:TctA family transporter